MSEPFIAEVRMLPYTFAPRNWAKCDGALLQISQNTALFSIIGTTYGGDGRTTMGLPNLQGRAPMHQGWGPGLTRRELGQAGGESTVTLTDASIPGHTHQLRGKENNPNSASAYNPQNNTLGKVRFPQSPDFAYKAALSNPVSLNAASLPVTSGGQGHNNMQPYLGVQFCIALQGIYPTRS